jgi:hypothetical protein
MPKNDVGNQPIRGGGCQVTYHKGALAAPNGWRVQPHTKQYPGVPHETREFLHAQDESYVAEYLRVIPKLYKKTGLVGKLTEGEKAVRAEELKEKKDEKAMVKQEKKEFNKNKKRPSRAKDAKERLEAEGPEEGCEWSESISRDEVEIYWEERHGAARTCIAPYYTSVRWHEGSLQRKAPRKAYEKASRKASPRASGEASLDTFDDSTVVLSKKGLSSEEGYVVPMSTGGDEGYNDVSGFVSGFEDGWDEFDRLWGKAQDPFI